MKPRHAYTGKVPLTHSVTFSKPSRTKQSFKDECDINVIMAQYQQTGVIDFVTKHAPQYIDCTGHDFMEAQNTIAQASSMFNDLPSSLRARFDNDPAKLLDFVHDENNRTEAEKLGLVVRPLPQSPPPAASAAPPDPSTTPAAT